MYMTVEILVKFENSSILGYKKPIGSKRNENKKIRKLNKYVDIRV